MDDLITHGREARADWRAYHSKIEEADPRYHNRPRLRGRRSNRGREPSCRYWRPPPVRQVPQR